MDIFKDLGITKLNNSEVYTPQEVVDSMIDLLPDEVFNQYTKFLDPACKSGRFLITLKNRLFHHPRMIEAIPNDQERIKHIFEKQLFGIATSPTTHLLCRRCLYGGIDSKYKNIIYIENYLRLMGDKTTDYKKLITKEFGEMTFDVVISNPPYQMNTGGGTQSKPLYNAFVENADTICNKYMCMIIPNKYFGGGMGLNNFRDFMRTNKHIEKYVNYLDVKECFKDIVLAGGVGYFLINKNYTGKCDFTSIIKGIEHSKVIDLDKYDFIVSNIKNLNIIDKVLNQCEKTMCKIVHPISLFALPTDIVLDYRTTAHSKKDTDLKIWYTRMQSCYIDRNCITNGKEYIDKYCVMIGSAISGNADQYENIKCISSIFVKQPGEVCTQAYIAIGGWDDKTYAENCISYLKTRFARFLLQSALSSIHISSDKFCFVPMQDFTHPLTDEELYKKYNLTQEEIDYIESTIKPMN